MRVLVINAGSSSLKYQLLDTKTQEVYAKGNCERIGIDGSFVGHEEDGGERQRLEVALPDHKHAIKHVFEILDAAGFDEGKIEGIGHRVVQGGWYFPESKVVTDETLGWVREVAPWRRCTTMWRPTSSRSAAKCSPPSATSSLPTRPSTTACPRRPGATPCRAMWWTSCTSASMVRMAPRIATSGGARASS